MLAIKAGMYKWMAAMTLSMFLGFGGMTLSLHAQLQSALAGLTQAHPGNAAPAAALPR